MARCRSPRARRVCSTARCCPLASKIGSVLQADAEVELDGITILSVTTNKEKAEKSGLLDLMPSDKPFEAVTQQLAKRERSDRGDRAPPSRRSRRRSPTAPRAATARLVAMARRRAPTAQPATVPARRSSRRRPSRRQHAPAIEGHAPSGAVDRTSPRRPSCRSDPKPKRLKPGRAHRNAVLADLPEEQRPVAERALQGGLPAVRQAVNEQNIRLEVGGQARDPRRGSAVAWPSSCCRGCASPSGSTAPTRPRPTSTSSTCATCAASWPPVTTRWSPATSRPVPSPTSSKACARHQAGERAGPVVRRHRRRHRCRSRHPCPQALVAAAQGRRSVPHRARQQAGRLRRPRNLTADALPDRWVAVLEAAAFSPVRTHVLPAPNPTQVNDELLATVKRVGPLLPQIAALFEIEVKPGCLRAQAAAPDPTRRAEESPGHQPPPRPKAATPDRSVRPTPESPAETPAAAVPADEAPTQETARGRARPRASQTKLPHPNPKPPPSRGRSRARSHRSSREPAADDEPPAEPEAAAEPEPAADDETPSAATPLEGQPTTLDSAVASPRANDVLVNRQ